MYDEIWTEVAPGFAERTFQSIARTKGFSRMMKQLDQWAERALQYTRQGRPIHAQIVGVQQETIRLVDSIIEEARQEVIDAPIWTDEGVQVGRGPRPPSSIGPEALARRIEQRWIEGKDSISRVRARTIARTQTVSSSNWGTIEGARETGLDLIKFWIATADRRTRSTHLRAHGQERELDGKFQVGAALLDFPGDPNPDGTHVAREVINCRCTVAFRERAEPKVIEKEGLEESDLPKEEKLPPKRKKRTPTPAPRKRPREKLPEPEPELPLQEATPVADSLTLTGVTAGQRTAVERALKAIDDVHGDGPLPKIQINGAASSWVREADAAYKRTLAGEALEIGFKRTTKNIETSIIHEIGHFLDHRGLGAELAAPRYWSEGIGVVGKEKELLDELFGAISKSKSVKELQNFVTLAERARGLGQTGYAIPGTDGLRYGVNGTFQYIEGYLLTRIELFARSYAQYIATKAAKRGSSALLEQVLPDAEGVLKFQWTRTDFEAIEKAFDKIFEAKGWTR